MKFTKEHEGKVIYGIPTDNNAYRWGGGPEQFTVIMVKREYVELRRKDYGASNDYCPNTGATRNAIISGQSKYSGWRFFESLEDINRYEELHEKRLLICDYFDWRNQSKWSEELIDQVYDLIHGIDGE